MAKKSQKISAAPRARFGEEPPQIQITRENATPAWLLFLLAGVMLILQMIGP